MGNIRSGLFLGQCFGRQLTECARSGQCFGVHWAFVESGHFWGQSFVGESWQSTLRVGISGISA